ncbi:DUF4198 domain-containing protein [Dyadobacter subterraneus]|uniref:DUF4198 domain-containing protein n=1 Tax=Dyadobacter subterraneus TaxID=2773304 RepID=A0ABR9WGY7_9BACT|nr:DUF4198 domain-containing protein [Dyadobacter subterraneus]MBE9464772.1 DUF4198 domain-containing protein [Dyadobacter subterraneus]
MKRTISIFVLLLIAVLGKVSAHALWIQTSTVGKAGQKQAIKIVYSEPNDKPEKIADWYSDVKDFTLWVTGPDKHKVKLPTTEAVDHFTSEFTPEKEGVYTISVSHTAKELGGKTKYQFNASAVVAIGKSVAGNDPALNPNDISVFADASKTYKVNKPFALTGFIKEKPADNLQVAVHSPSGWNREISTNTQGVAEFTPIWPGTYSIEASKSEKEEGEHNGKNYTSVWRCATVLLDVK